MIGVDHGGRGSGGEDRDAGGRSATGEAPGEGLVEPHHEPTDRPKVGEYNTVDSGRSMVPPPGVRDRIPLP